MKVSASVYMTLKVEILVGSWEASQSFEQLHTQAEREARQTLSNLLQHKDNDSIRMISDSAVMHVVTAEKK